jgi:hypothetical protein
MIGSFDFVVFVQCSPNALKREPKFLAETPQNMQFQKIQKGNAPARRMNGSLVYPPPNIFGLQTQVKRSLGRAVIRNFIGLSKSIHVPPPFLRSMERKSMIHHSTPVPQTGVCPWSYFKNRHSSSRLDAD